MGQGLKGDLKAAQVTGVHLVAQLATEGKVSHILDEMEVR